MPAIADNLGQRLGYPRESRLVLFHADDMGMCHSANVGGAGVLEAGVVKAASVMVPCPWFPEAAEYHRQHRDADIGLHLTLNSEWKPYRWGPVAREGVGGLVDQEGYMWSSVSSVLHNASPEEVERELRAQIERALGFGMKPTHLDSHMGTLFASSALFGMYLRVAEEYDIPPMLIRYTPAVQATLDRMGVSLPGSLFASLSDRGIPMLDALLTGVEGDNYESRRQSYVDALESLEPGVTEIILHPAVMSDEISHTTNSAVVRDLDYRILSDPLLAQTLEELQIKPIGYRDLMPLWKSRKKG